MHAHTRTSSHSPSVQTHRRRQHRRSLVRPMTRHQNPSRSEQSMTQENGEMKYLHHDRRSQSHPAMRACTHVRMCACMRAARTCVHACTSDASEVSSECGQADGSSNPDPCCARAWRGAARRRAARCGMAWRGAAQCGVAWFGVYCAEAEHGAAWLRLTWHGGMLC